jgi:carboxymethylenebutenolidase
MCHGDDASPPPPPVRGGVASHGDLVLTAADGNRLLAYGAHPDAPSSLGMVVLPDVRGLHHFYKELARRFAEAGLHAIAIDYFGRTAETDDRSEHFPFREHVAQMTREGVAHDVAAAVGWLRSLPGAAVTSVYTVGFCMGGAHSWGQSAEAHDLAGCIGFYGVPSRVRDRVRHMRAPLLLLVAGQDFTPLAEFEQFDRELAAAGVPHEMHVYPDAPHSFFDRAFDQHQAACADAWQRILAFVDAHRR